MFRSPIFRSLTQESRCIEVAAKSLYGAVGSVVVIRRPIDVVGCDSMEVVARVFGEVRVWCRLVVDSGYQQDVVVEVSMMAYRLTGDPKFKPPQKLIDMVGRGELGRKTGKGFYSYKQIS